MKLTYLGQSAFYINFDGHHLVFDPMITSNPMATNIKLDDLEVEYLFLTHGHFDHVLDAEYLAKKTGAKIISNYEIVSWYQNKGCKSHPMNVGGKASFDFGTVKYVHAVHSSMLPDGSYGGAAGGFVIWNESQCLYVAGDTALTLDMKLLPMTCPQLSAAILPIGDNFTMGYEDAVHAATFIQCDTIIGCHFDTYEYIKLDHQAAKQEFKNAGKELILLDIGQSITL